MTRHKLAQVISILLGPHIWLPIILLVTLLTSGLTTFQKYILFPTLTIFQIIIPLSYIQIALHLGKVSAWDLPRREERYLFLIVSFISYLMSVILIYLFGNLLLLHLSFIILLLLIILMIITYFWKISLHSSINTIGAIFINFLFGWNLPWLYISIPLIIWARLRLKRHNIFQLLAGMLVSGTVVLALLYLFDYL